MPKRYGTDTPVPLGFLEQFVFPVVKAKHPAPEGQNLDKERLSTSSPQAE